MSSAETHNRLAREFVQTVIGQTDTYAEVMVVVESAVLAAMMSITRVHKVTPAASVAMVELAIQQATERFARANTSGAAE